MALAWIQYSPVSLSSELHYVHLFKIHVTFRKRFQGEIRAKLAISNESKTAPTGVAPGGGVHGPVVVVAGACVKNEESSLDGKGGQSEGHGVGHPHGKPGSSSVSDSVEEDVSLDSLLVDVGVWVEVDVVWLVWVEDEEETDVDVVV